MAADVKQRRVAALAAPGGDSYWAARKKCWLTLYGGRWVQRRFGLATYRVLGERRTTYLPQGGVELQRPDGTRFMMGWGEAMTLVPVWRVGRRRRAAERRAAAGAQLDSGSGAPTF